MSEASNVERQLAHQKATQPRREVGKRPIKKGELMVIFIKTNSKPPNDENFNNGKGKQKGGGRWITLQESKEKKYPFDDDDVQGIFDELMATEAISLPEPK